MWEELSVRKLDLRFEKEDLRAFLSLHALTLEEDVETAFAVFDEEENLAACGCAAGRLLKCFASREEVRGRNVLGSLVSALVQDRFQKGIYGLFVITRAHNEPLFTGCGFTTVVKTEALCMLENKKNGPEQFCLPFFEQTDGRIGAIVMHANPFTLGHRHLIETAAKECALLHVFVLEEEVSVLPARDRLRLVREGTADLLNVRVHPGGPYMISKATFPTYFLKKEEDAVSLQCELDAALFAKRLSKALGVTVRYLGEEPCDPVTARYNEALKKALPEEGVEVKVIPRLAINGQAVSASRVRALYENKDMEAIRPLVPPATFTYLEARL